MNITKVFGAPGTGKTTFLMRAIHGSGLPINEIGYVSYMRRPIEQVLERLGENRSNAPYFRTQHSMNHYLLKLKKDHLAESHIHDFPARFTENKLREIQGNSFTSTINYTNATTDTIDDKFYTAMQKERVQLLPFDYVPMELRGNAGLYLDFKARYRAWMKENNYTDFIGMIERGIEEGVVPPVQLLCVDEWQDMTPLQIKQIVIWTQNIARSIHAGDDDQTIHEWAGAHHEGFLQFPTFTTEFDTIVLNKTYRLPRDVLAMSVNFIRRNKHRVDKEFSPENDTTGIIAMTHLDRVADYLKRHIKDQSSMVLTRTNYIRRAVVVELNKRGVPTRKGNPHAQRVLEMIMENDGTLNCGHVSLMADENLRAYFPVGPVLRRGARAKLTKLSADMGTTALPIDALIEHGATEALVTALKEHDWTILKVKKDVITEEYDLYTKYGKGFRPVIVSTIHQQKGAEADNVVVMLDVPKVVYNESYKPENIEAERRVWYVAMTRTKRNLFFVPRMFRGMYESPLTRFIKVYLQEHETRTPHS